jgi:hypothetical protein
MKPLIMDLVKNRANKEYMSLLRDKVKAPLARRISNRIELHMLFKVFDAAFDATLPSVILQHIQNRIQLVHAKLQQDRFA